MNTAFHRLMLELPWDGDMEVVPPLRNRRKRTSLAASQRLALDSYFDVNQRPDNTQMADIAKTMELEFEVCFIKC